MAGRLAGLQASPLGSTCVDGRGRCDAAVEGSWDRVGRRRHGESFRSVQAPRKRCGIRLARAMPIIIPFLNFRCKSPILQQRNAITAHPPASASGDLHFYFFKAETSKESGGSGTASGCLYLLGKRSRSGPGISPHSVCPAGHRPRRTGWRRHAPTKAPAGGTNDQPAGGRGPAIH
jgi:hypothetical protein